MTVEKEFFGSLPDGTPVDLYTLKNERGAAVKICSFGGIVTSLNVPDRQGRWDNVVLGYDALEEYRGDPFYFGALIGRYANRVAGGIFFLDGVERRLPRNEGENHLHGGRVGFDKVVWESRVDAAPPANRLRLRYTSEDGEEGWPGNLLVTVFYSLTDKNELKIDYSATTDRATPVNLTHHSYFNLAGQGAGDILGHELMINARRFTPVNDQLIPTGELAPVAGTPLDFTRTVPIGVRIDDRAPQLLRAGGYDHNWVLEKENGGPSLAARVVEPSSGRTLTVHTTEPGLQFYSGNFLKKGIRGKGGTIYYRRSGFCLEAQHFPDSPNQPAFPSTLLLPGDAYTQTTVYRFGVEK